VIIINRVENLKKCGIYIFTLSPKISKGFAIVEREL
jgi:hypothetical protein